MTSIVTRLLSESKAQGKRRKLANGLRHFQTRKYIQGRRRGVSNGFSYSEMRQPISRYLHKQECWLAEGRTQWSL